MFNLAAPSCPLRCLIVFGSAGVSIELTKSSAFSIGSKDSLVKALHKKKRVLHLGSLWFVLERGQADGCYTLFRAKPTKQLAW